MDFSRFSADLALGHLTLRRRTLYPAELRRVVYEILCASAGLGGERSILLSYGDMFNSPTTTASVLEAKLHFAGMNADKLNPKRKPKAFEHHLLYVTPGSLSMQANVFMEGVKGRLALYDG